MDCKTKNKGGRPKKYSKEWADKQAALIPDLMKEGESIAHVSVALGISIETLYQCKKVSVKFSDAIKQGVTQSEVWWTDLGRDLATGEKTGNATVWIFNMKNRFKWRDTKKDYIQLDLTQCKNNLERIGKVIAECAAGNISLQDATAYRNIIKSFTDEETLNAIDRIKALEKIARGL